MKNLLFFLVFAFITGCTEKKSSPDQRHVIKYDFAYGKDPEQKMDIYLPKTQNISRDVFIIIHGGGWRGGNKSELTAFTVSMMKKFPNSVFANINYRLASTSQYAIPNQTDDISHVIRYLEKKLTNSPRFILLGNSAGGYLSMFYAYKFNTGRNIKAVVNIVGPADLSDPGFKSYEDYFFVERHLIDPKIVFSESPMAFASPISWVDTTSVPTLSYYGKNDRVIPFSQKEILDSVLNRNHVIHESLEFSGGHLDWLKEDNRNFLIDKIAKFLKRIENKTP